MKGTKTLLIVVSLLTGLATAFARTETNKVSSAKAKTQKAEKNAVPKDKAIDLTGSRIKRVIHRDGQITDGASQVVVIDREGIERSGAADLKQALSLRGIH